MRFVLVVLSASLLCACASVDMTPSSGVGVVASGGGANGGADGGLTETSGMRAKARYRVDTQAVRASRTIRLEPASFGPQAADTITDRQREVLSQTLNQALCRRLTRGFEVVAPGAPADLVVRAQITRMQTTGAGSAAASTLAGFASPIPFTPRLPVGLGSLVVEGTAVDAGGAPRAILVWGRGADMFTTKPRASAIGDAFTLARAFGGDFGKLLIQASDPFKAASGPKRDRRTAAKTECAAWGEGPGAAGFIGGRLGLPPEMTSQRPKP